MSATEQPLQKDVVLDNQKAAHQDSSEEAREEAARRRSRLPQRNRARLGTVPQRLLNVAFVFALALAGVCLVMSAVYLFAFLRSTNVSIETIVQNIGTTQSPGQLEAAINGRLVVARIALLSCGILVGLSFGFLGFALFLLGIRESINVDVDMDTYKAKFARMSPGVLIIICSSILIGVCATRQTPFWYENAVDVPGVSRPEDRDSKKDLRDRETTAPRESGNRDLPPRSESLPKP